MREGNQNSKQQKRKKNKKNTLGAQTQELEEVKTAVLEGFKAATEELEEREVEQ